MREITKTISIPVDGKPMDFRLAKPDVFSGAVLQKVPDRIFDRTATNLVYTLPATTIMEQGRASVQICDLGNTFRAAAVKGAKRFWVQRSQGKGAACAAP